MQRIADPDASATEEQAQAAFDTLVNAQGHEAVMRLMVARYNVTKACYLLPYQRADLVTTVGELLGGGE